MDATEREVYDYLRAASGNYVSLREISRRAGGKYRYREDPNWALPVLNNLVEQKIVESDSTGHYRLRGGRKAAKTPNRWLSPQMQRILEKNEKFKGVYNLDEPDKPGDPNEPA